MFVAEKIIIPKEDSHPELFSRVTDLCPFNLDNFSEGQYIIGELKSLCEEAREYVERL